MTSLYNIHLLMGFALLTSSLTAENFPYAPGTFENNKLQPWTIEKVRMHRDDAIGKLITDDNTPKSVPDKDAAANSEMLGYWSQKKEGISNETLQENEKRGFVDPETIVFKTVLDLTDMTGLVYIAIHVDDIANLSVTEIDDAGVAVGTTIPYDVKGTALWRVERSYKEFPTPIPAGRKYALKLNYQNTANLTDKYDGLIDYDGVTVFLMHQPSVDLDVDSDNTEGFVFTWGDEKEDKIEASADSSKSGKIIAVPLDPDADKDGVPDALDGFDGRGTLDETRFVQMVVNLPPNYDPETATLLFDYKMSDPRGLPIKATHTSSGFRLWTSDASLPRSTSEIPETPDSSMGYFIPEKGEISWKKLAAQCDLNPVKVKAGVYEGPAIILYIETVLTSGESGEITDLPFSEKEPITVTAKPSYQNTSHNTSDTVNIAVRCTGGVKLSGPEAILVNDNDDNDDYKWDYTVDSELIPKFIDDDLKPIRIEIVALDQEVKVKLSSEAMKGLGQTGTPTTGGLVDGFYVGATTTITSADTTGTITGDDDDGRSKKQWISAPYEITVPKNTTIIQNLFIEGQRNSATMDDVVIKATIIENPGLDAGNPPCLARTEDEHKMTVYQVDLDVDSNNDEGHVFSYGSTKEDPIEASKTLPGKIIVTGINRDSDNDGVPDYADGMGLPPVVGSATSSGICGVATLLVPILLELPTPIDLSKAEVTFDYSASIPRLNTDTDGGDIVPPSGALKKSRYSVKSGFRIWTCDAKNRPDNTATGRDVDNGAKCKFVPSGKKLKWNDLVSSAGSASGTRKITLYLEYVESGQGVTLFPGKHNINVEVSDGIQKITDKVCVTAVATRVKEVTFSGPSDWTLTSDDISLTYFGPHWMDEDNDGFADKQLSGTTKPKEHNYPIAYTRNTRPEVEAVFEIYGLPAGYSMKAKALTNLSTSIGSTMEFYEQRLNKNSSGSFEFARISGKGNLENEVQFYSTPSDPRVTYPGGGAVDAFQIDWTTTLDTIPDPSGGNVTVPEAWTDSNNTEHTLYVTLGDPNTTMRQETLFNIACRNGHGSQTADEVVDGIWAEFSDRIVSRVAQSTGVPDRDPTGMIYWKPGGNQDCGVAQLLVDGDASCGTWQEFFIQIARTQGLTTLQAITIDAPVPLDHAANYPTAVSEYESQFPMTNGLPTRAHYLAPSSTVTPAGPNHVYLTAFTNNRVNFGAFFVRTCDFTSGPFYEIPDWTRSIACQISSPAQGNPGTARGHFGNHAIVSYTPASTGISRYYDPSYGGTFIEDPNRQTRYEDYSFQAYGAYMEVRSWDAAASMWMLRRFVWYERDNPVSTRQCEFTPP